MPECSRISEIVRLRVQLQTLHFIYSVNEIFEHEGLNALSKPWQNNPFTRFFWRKCISQSPSVRMEFARRSTSTKTDGLYFNELLIATLFPPWWPSKLHLAMSSTGSVVESNEPHLLEYSTLYHFAHLYLYFILYTSLYFGGKYCTFYINLLRLGGNYFTDSDWNKIQSTN